MAYLTLHDSEERARPLIGRLIDAREKYSERPGQSSAEELIHRQDDLIAELKEQVRILLDRQGPDTITVGGAEQ